MHPFRLERPGRGGRTASRLAPLLCLLALVAFGAACPAPDDTNPGVSNDPPPTGADDRPIIITGGSLNLDFSPYAYTTCPGASAPMQRYCAGSGKITAVRMYDDEGGSDNSNLDCASSGDPCPGGNCRVVVTYRKGSDSSTVTVASEAAAGQVWVELDPSKLALRPDNQRMRFSKSARIDSVQITSGSTTVCSVNKPKATILITTGAAGKRP